MKLMSGCKPMEENGINDPDCQAGIDFCTELCPFEACIVAESDNYNKILLIKRKKDANDLYDKGESIDSIAKIIAVTPETIRTYITNLLKRKKLRKNTIQT